MKLTLSPQSYTNASYVSRARSALNFNWIKTRYTLGFKIYSWFQDILWVSRYTLGFKIYSWFQDILLFSRYTHGFKIYSWFQDILLVSRYTLGFKEDKCPLLFSSKKYKSSKSHYIIYIKYLSTHIYHIY